jgi:hypothetical protein
MKQYQRTRLGLRVHHDLMLKAQAEGMTKAEASSWAFKIVSSMPKQALKAYQAGQARLAARLARGQG